MSVVLKDYTLSDFFLDMNCERNEGGTRNLILRGNELIHIIGRRLEDCDLVNIVRYLKSNRDIITLELPYNEITDCGVYTLCEYFLEIPIIGHLNLIGNNITHRGAAFIGALKERLCLYSLRLSGNKIGDKGGIHLARLLERDIPLKYLDVSDTHQTMNGLAFLLTACMPSRNGNQKLEYIDLGRPLPQKYHQIPDAHAAEFVCQMIQDNKTLQELHLQQYQFDFRDMEILIDGLFVNKTLVCLDLNNNSIADDGVDYLCQYLKTGPNLECLMIGANKIGDFGALALSASLPFSKIKLLDVTNNRITDEGMKNIFYSIKKHVKMRALFFWGNKVTHESLVVLQRLFRTGVLKEKHTDVSIYCVDNRLQAAWNSHANAYTQRFYCVPAKKCSKISGTIAPHPKPPTTKPPIPYKYHVDNDEIGFPLCEWEIPECSWHFPNYI